MNIKIKLRPWFKIFLIFLIACCASSCENNIYHLYSNDKQKCITLIKDVKYSYVIDGYFNKIPDTNYLKFDTSQVDQIVNGIDGCWNDGNYKWSLLLRNGENIIENKLDSVQYKIYHSYKYDENFKPLIKRNCGARFLLIFEYGQINKVAGDLIVENP
jgi:hypothetical protein